MSDGNEVEHFEEISKREVAVQYFENLFQTSNPTKFGELLDGMEAKVTPSMNRELIKEVFGAEIKRAMKSLQNDRAPRANGFSSNFFQSFWSIAGPQVIQEVKQFFVSSTFPYD